jgi:hypothetical protein
MKICPVGAGSFHPENHAERIKLTVAFCNFAIPPKGIIQSDPQIRRNSLDLEKYGNK